MKNLLIITFSLFCNLIFGQINPTISIDNVPIRIQGGTSLPYWIGAGKTLALGQDAVSASVLEFNLNSGNLEFNQALNITATGTVPTGKVWKIEAIGIGINPNSSGFPTSISSASIPNSYTSPVVFSSPGTFYWIVPPGITSICVEAWGAGGGGGSSQNTTVTSIRAGGGGGGAYAYQCFNVTPGTNLEITVGSGGSGASNSISGGGIATSGGSSGITNLILAGGGGGGTGSYGTTYICGSGGLGGTSNAAFNVPGQNGTTPDCVDLNCTATLGSGGSSTYGGSGGLGGCASYSGTGPTIGNFPGGGGGGGSSSSSAGFWQGKSGANGQIKIYF
jgi:hypothetical protein